MKSLYAGIPLTNQKFNQPQRPNFRECIAVLTDHLRRFPGFSTADLEGLDRYWEYFQAAKNRSLADPGVICPYIYFICYGAVRQYADDEHGRHIIDLRTSGYFVSLFPSFMNQHAALGGLNTARGSFGLRLSLTGYRAMIHQRPAFVEFFRSMQEEETRRILGRLVSLQSLDARGRYELLKEENFTVFNHFTMLDIANYLGIKPETLSRLRNEK